MNYTMRRVVIAALFALVSALVHQCARAQTLQTLLSPSGAVGLQYGPGSVKFMDRSPLTALMERKITLGANQGVMAAERYGLTVGGNAIEAVASRSLSNPSIAVAAVAVGGAAWAGLATGSAISRVLGMDDPLNPERLLSSADGWLIDKGKDAPTDNGKVMKYRIFEAQTGHGLYTSQWLASPTAACSAFQAQVSMVNQPGPGYTNTISVSITSQSAVLCGLLVTSTSADGQYHDYQSRSGSIYAQEFDSDVPNCPAVVDSKNLAWSNERPGLMNNQRCPTGQYGPATQQEAEAAMKKNVDRRPTVLPQLVGDILSKGIGIEAGPREVSGPASVSGQPQTTTTTTTGPDGQPATTTTTNSPTTKYTYGGDTINYTTTNVTVTNNGGNTTTTTTTTGGGAATQPDADDPCSKHPDTAGCAKLGTADGDPEWDTKDIVFAPVDMPAGSCPADRYFTFHTWALPLHYQPACDAAPVVKIGMLLCATITAIAIITGAVTK